MGTLSAQEATIIRYIERFARAGSPREDLQPFINRLKTKKAKDLAEKRIAAVNAPKFKPQPKVVRPPKVNKTRQRKLSTQPVQIQPTYINGRSREYLELAQEYKKRTGKHFKRTAWEMRQRMSKLEALKRRIQVLNSEGMVHDAMKDLAKKNSMEFHLGGAL